MGRAIKEADMFLDALTKCDNEIRQLICCGKRTPCNCEECLRDDYYNDNHTETYNCQKKMDTYVIKYGPSYVSEIYHYLANSNILDNFNNSQLNVISLGCGFAPDFYAIQSYCIDKQLKIKLNYHGLDISEAWNTARPSINEGGNFIHADLTQSFSLQNANIVFVCKSFSTMLRNNIHNIFLQNLHSAITQSMPKDSFLIFVDVNHCDMGRDIFDSSLSKTITPTKKYYFCDAKYKEYGWNEIKSTNVIYQIPQNLSVSSIPQTNNTVIFEYRK